MIWWYRFVVVAYYGPHLAPVATREEAPKHSLLVHLHVLKVFGGRLAHVGYGGVGGHVNGVELYVIHEGLGGDGLEIKSYLGDGGIRGSGGGGGGGGWG